jgi:uncharacterized protein (TIRG00374 family)
LPTSTSYITFAMRTARFRVSASFRFGYLNSGKTSLPLPVVLQEVFLSVTLTYRKFLTNLLKTLLPLLLGGGILYWMYRGFNWREISLALEHDVNWGWMVLSLPFGILAQVLRGLRWRQLLEPMGEHARVHTSINAIFLSYAASLVVPRVGEVMRCGILKRRDDVSFSRSLGTVVTERVVDSLIVVCFSLVILAMQIGVFMVFFHRTGVNLSDLLHQFTYTGYWVTGLCLLTLFIGVWFLIRKLTLFSRVGGLARNLWEGILSLGKVKNLSVFSIYSLAIWVCYFFHFYFTFYCFGFTSHLGLMAGLVSFVVGTIAVIVPTPNGAGPWHFAVKTILVLYGVGNADAAFYVLVVHAVQTMLIIVLGIYALVALQFTRSVVPQEAPAA